MVDKVSYHLHDPQRGDVIVFIAPPHHELNYVKRIIGIPGDVLTIHGATVILDGVTLKETYVQPSRQGNPNVTQNMHLVIPPGKYFVMGDDRINSSDSREWGLVPRDFIIGRAALIYWPLGEDNNGFLPNVSSVFANVHQSSTPGKAAALPVHVTSADALLVFTPGMYLFCIGLRKKRRPR